MCTSENELLEFHSDTVEVVRKQYNLENPRRMDEAINILDDWLKMQNHLVKKDFPREYLERTILSCKGSLERSKQRIDKLCTIRTLMPEYFPDDLTKEMFTILKKYIAIVPLTKLTKEHYRVFICKIFYEGFDVADLPIFYKYIVLVGEYLKMRDYNSGYIIVFDLIDINILNLLSKISPVDIRRLLILTTEGYGMRLKKLYILSSSKFITSLVSLVKQILSVKLGERLRVLNDWQDLHTVLDKHVLPADFGGDGKPLKEIFDQWLDTVCSKNNLDFCREMNKAKTNEMYRTVNDFNEHYLGMPGSFRALSVD